MQASAPSAPVLCWIIWICGGCCNLNRESEYPEGVLDLGAPSVFWVLIPLYPSIRPLISTEARGEDCSNCESERPSFYPDLVLILSQFDFVFQKAPKLCTFKGSEDHRNTKRNWLIFGRSCAYYGRRTIGNKNWFGSEAFFFDIIFAGQQFSRTCKSVIRLSFLAGRGEPQAIAFIYRDRLIWDCRFRQRQLRCTQRNSSCKVSYEYEEVADFPCVIVYL